MRIVTAIVSLGLHFAAQGAVISFNSTGVGGLYSTGFSTGNSVLSTSAADPHYALIAIPVECAGVACQEGGSPGDLLGPNTYVVGGPNGTFPLQSGGWLANDGNSQWIGPRADQTNPVVGGSAVPGVEVFASNTSPYVYRTVFNLTGLGILPSTANIQLAWASDDPSAAGQVFSHIRMCAVTSIIDPACAAGFAVAGSANSGTAGLTTVTIDSGFASGLMALDFVVYNEVATGGLNPSGLRVDILSATGSDVPVGVPEPAGVVLLGIGVSVLAGRVRRA